jgi:hypothetical protein
MLLSSFPVLLTLNLNSVAGLIYIIFMLLAGLVYIIFMLLIFYDITGNL